MTCIKANTDVRQCIRNADCRQWEVAEHLNIREDVFSKMLRHELTPHQKEEVFRAISELTAERGRV